LGSIVDSSELASEARRELRSLPRLDTQSVRRVRRRYSELLRTESSAAVRQFVRVLLRDASWAERVVAFEVLGGHEALVQVDDRLAEQMAKGLSDWASVDLYGVTVLGQAWRDGRVTDAKIHAWTKSSDRWKRRLALVATVPLNIPSRGGTGDSQRTLQVCRLLRDDRDDMVVKALSWALRELAKRDPGVVRSFIRDEGDRLAARVKREVSNKLRTGLKTPRK
jgi:3-methyladenine DNA glycosylase AlkD